PGRCPRCGKDNPAENRFCGACGQTLAQAEAVR
ncbi:MAG: zinc ribbon domain-containing protein, partial [Acidobacteria bacterium]|nr:zinc ribbon domain-containing protein [Acidobacteriota bacterium]